MKIAKWIIGFIIAGIGSYIIYTQEFAQTPSNDSLKKEKSGIEIKKRFDENGNLKSDAELKNGMKHGVAHNYYSDGSVHSEIHYINNVKEGNSTWFFENGKPYRVTPFKAGKKHGIQKKYYKSGKLLAEIPYQNGKLIEGTKEYTENGKVLKKALIVTRDRDLTMLAGQYIVEVKLNEALKIKEAYYKKENKSSRIIASKNDKKIFEFRFISTPNDTEFLEPFIFVEYKSSLGNPVLISKKINLVLGG